MKLNLKIWRQQDKESKGSFVKSEIDEEKAEENMQRFRKRFPKIEPFFISAVLEDGLEPLRQSLLKHLR